MALRDYILCKKCECKLIYDVGDSAREWLEERWGAPDASMWTELLLCPDCIKALEAERDRLDAYRIAEHAEHARLIAELSDERDQLQAARYSYASLFSPNADGEPDVGSIHQNIRGLIAERDQLLATPADKREDLRCVIADISAQCAALWAERDQLRAELEECRRDAERYRHVRTNPAMLLHLSNKAFDDAIDAARKGEGDI